LQTSEPVKYFVGMMNKRAADFGLPNTHFVNPHGLDARGHYSSAYDLASLTWYAMRFPLFNEIVRHADYETPGHPLKNTNKMLTRYTGAEGVKTGYTGRAGLCLITSATRNGRRLISVVLNAPKWVEDSSGLLDYGFARLQAGPVRTQTLAITRRASGLIPVTTLDTYTELGMLAAALSKQEEISGPIDFLQARIICTWTLAGTRRAGALGTLSSGA
jgi:D-alanyl-D-alanine carboxypeptidase